MSTKPLSSVPEKKLKITNPGMMGDGTEEQNLNETGDPSLRVKKNELDTAFGKKTLKDKIG